MRKGKFFPNFTIDAKKTAFRDDAIGLRPRLKDKVVGGNKVRANVFMSQSSDMNRSPLRGSISKSSVYYLSWL